MTRKKPTPQKDFLVVLEDAVRATLVDKEATPGDRLKAVEIGAKLLQIRHKIEGGGDAGSFFGTG